MDYREKSEIRDGMQIDWDMPITMDDGLVLRCDVYRPTGDGKYPVIMTYGPYGKWLHFEDLYTDQWRRMRRSSGRTDRLDQQVSVLGGGRSGEMGARRLRLHSRRQPRRRPLARCHRHHGRCARRRTWRSASTGPACSPGRTARSGSTASLITPRTSGRRRHCSPSIWPRSALGKGPPISTATWRTTAVSSAGASCRTGRKHRSTPSRTGAALAGSRAG